MRLLLVVLTLTGPSFGRVAAILRGARVLCCLSERLGEKTKTDPQGSFFRGGARPVLPNSSKIEKTRKVAVHVEEREGFIKVSQWA